jgi:hypothetical protein
MLHHWWLIVAVALLGWTGSLAAEKMTPPSESLSGLRPGTLTVDSLVRRYGKPKLVERNGLLGLYGGDDESEVYGWFLIENPGYSVPDLVVETAPGSERVELVMAIGYDGIKTEKGLTCFASEEEVVKAYGTPDFAFAAPMNGVVLRELYYTRLGLSIDLAPTGPTPDRQVIAMYVTYPEYLARAIALRKELIEDGVGRDVTFSYRGGQES